jgi:hypothetical protein
MSEKKAIQQDEYEEDFANWSQGPMNLVKNKMCQLILFLSLLIFMWIFQHVYIQVHTVDSAVMRRKKRLTETFSQDSIPDDISDN